MGSINKLCGWLGLLFVASSIVSFIGFSDSAKAQEIDPRSPKYTEELVLSTNSDPNRVINHNWINIINGDYKNLPSLEDLEVNYYNPDYQFTDEPNALVLTELEHAISTGQYAVVQTKSGNNNDITVYYTTSSTNGTVAHDDSLSGSGYYNNDYWRILTPNEPIKRIRLSLYTGSGSMNGSITVHMLDEDVNNPDISLSIASNDEAVTSIYLLYFDNIEYPSDWVGGDLPTGGQTPEKESLYPHFSYVVTDKEIKATHDLSQQLPDLPEPDEGWQNNHWQVMWYLFNCSSIDDDDIIDCPDRESVHSKLLERDEIYEWEVDDYGDYLLTAEFRYQSCLRSPSWPETPDYCYLNSEHDEYSFVPGRTVYLPIDGNNIFGNTADLNCDVAGNCYDDTRFKNCNVIVAIATLSFDDFNYADCLENISLLANMLSFDTIRFSNSWVSNGNCYTLGTLGNWLNLDNKHVCPYFSNEVRNTVTPFITFLLGLIMVKFIAGRGTHGSREVDI